MGAYAIAATGNLAKMSAYYWNPIALNLPIWIELLRTSIIEYKRTYGSDSLHIQAVKNREEINCRFDELQSYLNSI